MLTPNTPAKRLQFIAKTYAKRPYLVFDMIDIIARTIGEDEWRAAIRRAAKADVSFNAALSVYGLSSARASDVREGPALYEYAQTVVQLVDELPGFRRRHPAEGIFPWMATQLARALKKSERLETENPYSFSGGYAQMAQTFAAKGTALGQWFQDERPDLTKLPYEDAMAAFEDWNETRKLEGEEVPQGDVVYEFGDGWTIQELETSEQLDVEGEIMQHCVGSYCDVVQEGKSVIYSLRDPKGRPHATIEFDPHLKFVKQVQGKQNRPPEPRYQAYVDKFLASDVLPQMDPDAKAIMESLAMQHGRLDDEFLRHETQDWLGRFGKDAVDWVQMGFHSAEDAEKLKDEGVTVDEVQVWPQAAWARWSEGDLGYHRGPHGTRHTVEDFARLMKIAVLLYRQGLAGADETASSATQAHARQTWFPFEQDDKVAAEALARDSDWDWDFDWGSDSEELEWLSLLGRAEQWAKTDLDLDDIEGWIREQFSPGQAAAWSRIGTGRYGIIYPKAAAVLRMHGVTPAQVETAVDEGRLGRAASGIDLSERLRLPLYKLNSSEAGEIILEALGITPNRQRVRRRG